ncbi:MAG: hypothetical protein AMJ53_00570 [Gammaproteobacteria bacterium SG8_11]|nr:MAG: hypothetical protein AMJ53_00570 [Gammaproteobacteria bacterium SG8_11]
MANGIDPFRYLQQVSENYELINTREEINAVLDELEFVFELVEPQFQDLATDLIAKLTTKLKQLDD